MAIKEIFAKVVRKRLFSKDGVPRYRDPWAELEEVKREVKRKKIPKLKRRKPKPMDIEFYKDVERLERRNKGK